MYYQNNLMFYYTGILCDAQSKYSYLLKHLNFLYNKIILTTFEEFKKYRFNKQNKPVIKSPGM